MLKFVQHRVADRRILRLIRKWPKAGERVTRLWRRTLLVAARGAGSTRIECIVSRYGGYQNRACFILTLTVASPPVI
jgi:hypothetical protein